MAHYSLLNDHTDDPNSVAASPHSACLKKHFTPLAKVHYKMVELFFAVFVMLAQLFNVQSED